MYLDLDIILVAIIVTPFSRVPNLGAIPRSTKMVTKLPASGSLFLFLFCTLCLLCVLTLRVLTTSLLLAKCTFYTFFYSLSLSLSLHLCSENSQETKDIGRDRTRTCNPQIRSLVPYPLGHTVLDDGMFTSAMLCVATFINRRC